MIPARSPVLFDIGANRGQTLELFVSIFPQARIHAFEPSSTTFAALQSIRHGENVSLHQVAMGAKNGETIFHNYEDSCLSSIHRLDPNAENEFKNTKLSGTEIVPVRTVDWFVREGGIMAIDLLKIDTQGHDLEVLRGAARSFQNGLIRNVYIELNFIKLYQNQGDVRQIMNFFAHHRMQLVEFYEKVRGTDSVLQWCNALYTRLPVA
jgi:FkbM family methyltransferase